MLQDSRGALGGGPGHPPGLGDTKWDPFLGSERVGKVGLASCHTAFGGSPRGHTVCPLPPGEFGEGIEGAAPSLQRPINYIHELIARRERIT